MSASLPKPKQTPMPKPLLSMPQQVLQNQENLSSHAFSDDAPHIVTSKYELIEKLGKGSQGQVWKARRKTDGQYVAIKLLNVHSVKTWKQYELFQREGKLLSHLNIPNVAPVYEYIEDLESDSPCVCIVQKYVEGETMAKLIKRKHRFSAEAIYDIIVQILRILQALHSHQPVIIHRDIKPSNLMLTPAENGRYRVTLIDFGAVANPQVQKGGSTVAGTYGYMPPEQLMGQAQPASDIYALGAVALQLLSGTSPADIEMCDFKLVIEPYLSHIPPAVVQTISQMLEPSLEKRLCDYNILIAQFRSLADKRPPSFLKLLLKHSAYKLETVESICQPGNYEIWQNLNPEKDVCQLSNILNSIPDDTQSLQNIQKFQKQQDKLKLRHIFIYLASFLILPMTFFFIFQPDKEELGVFWLCTGVISFISFIFSTLITSYIQNRNHIIQNYDPLEGLFANKKLSFYSHTKQPQLPVPKKSKAIHKELLLHLVASSHKTVGKITSIQYIPSDSQQSKSITLKKQPVVLTREQPRFLVTYQYQISKPSLPMSMRKANFFEHTFYGETTVYTAPEKHYKVGDLIPLLWSLERDQQDDFTLYAMPYPYPFAELFNTKDVVYHTFIPSVFLSARSEDELKYEIHHYTPKIHHTMEAKLNGLSNLIDLLTNWEFSDAYILQAKLFSRLSNKTATITCYKKAASMGNTFAMNILGGYYKAKNEYQKAVEYYIDAFRSGDLEVYKHILEIYTQLSDKTALSEWQNIVIMLFTSKANEGDIAACHHLIELHQTQQEYECVRYWAEKAYAMGDKTVILNIAKAHFFLENYDESIEWYMKSSCFDLENGIIFGRLYRIKKASLSFLKPSDPQYQRTKAQVDYLAYVLKDCPAPLNATSHE